MRYWGGIPPRSCGKVMGVKSALHTNRHSVKGTSVPGSHRLFAASLLLTACALLPGCSGGGGGGGGSGAGVDGPVEEVVWGDGPNSVALRWNLPQATENGEPLTNLAGVAVYIRSENGSSDVARIPVGFTDQTVIRGMDSGSFSFTVAAYTSSGVEGAQSEAVATGLP